MHESTIWLREIIENYSAIQYILVFIGTAIGGDFILIALAFLSAQGILPLPLVIIFSFLGTYFSDVVLFLLARTTWLHYVISHRYADKTTSAIVKSLQRVGRGNHMLSLTIAKFLVGTRVVIMLYADKTDIHIKKFLSYNAVATIVWVLAVAPIGFLLGLGFTYLAEIFENIYVGVGLVLCFLVLAAMAESWLKNRFTGPETKI